MALKSTRVIFLLIACIALMHVVNCHESEAPAAGAAEGATFDRDACPGKTGKGKKAVSAEPPLTADAIDTLAAALKSGIAAAHKDGSKDHRYYVQEAVRQARLPLAANTAIEHLLPSVTAGIAQGHADSNTDANGPCCCYGTNCVYCTGTYQCACDRNGCCTCSVSSCFPATGTVQLHNGSVITMADLRIGDRVLTANSNGELAFEEVYMFTHQDKSVPGFYTRIELTDGRALVLSPRHFIPRAVSGDESYLNHEVVAANELRVGDVVWVNGPSKAMTAVRVASISREFTEGAFNPMTMSGTIVVDQIVASAHSDWFLDGIVSPHTQSIVYQALFSPLRALHRMLGTERMQSVWEYLESCQIITRIREFSTAHKPHAGQSPILALAVSSISE